MSKASSEHITFISLIFAGFSIWSYSNIENEDYQVKKSALESEKFSDTSKSIKTPEHSSKSKNQFTSSFHYLNSSKILTIPIEYPGVKSDLLGFGLKQSSKNVVTRKSAKNDSSRVFNSKIDFPTPTTGCSKNHEIEVKKHLKNILSFLNSTEILGKFNPPTTLVIWNLQKLKHSNHSDHNFGKYMKTKFQPIFENTSIQLVVKDFPFESYPRNVQDMHKYAWKVMINTNMLLNYGSVWWFDSSIAVKKDKYQQFADIVYKSLFEDKSCFLFTAPGASHDYVSRTCQTTMKYLEPTNNGERTNS